MKKFVVIAATCALLGSATAALAAGDATAGKAKSATCAACHNADGNSANPQYPKLAGQGADYLLKQLQDYKAGVRVNPIMAGMVAPLSPQDMEDLAAYFASQQVARAAADPALAPQGEALFRGGNLTSGVSACAACHGTVGAGNPLAKFPAIAAQHAEYLQLQLKAFRAMERTNDAGQMMRSIAAKMTDPEIKAVSSYIQGLQ
ncbi:MAG: c-type cytochrome [Candidatus Competibacter denitrificans]|jgi:cytochrome c553|uniref:Cytochrome c4 n=1 Tax=Candidatus Competibacter denitrificans Run_A_D11 TaxID=1400863 RepID=W6MA89_9GAMM|nr:c-type cytochrome [Candidatus Competibacter denitrificans]CDI02805.1 Cytochrome c4 [Candidatus Competibacter denitrificans Run_A_D11]HAS85370.1 cytochrome c4 [Candidatus Competibacteraceae bacterium]HRC69467.1 c-type cytochrome [Candidatus Competibacter denitrificans]